MKEVVYLAFLLSSFFIYSSRATAPAQEISTHSGDNILRSVHNRTHSGENKPHSVRPIAYSVGKCTHSVQNRAHSGDNKLNSPHTFVYSVRPIQTRMACMHSISHDDTEIHAVCTSTRISKDLTRASILSTRAPSC